MGPQKCDNGDEGLHNMGTQRARPQKGAGRICRARGRACARHRRGRNRRRTAKTGMEPDRSCDYQMTSRVLSRTDMLAPIAFRLRSGPAGGADGGPKGLLSGGRKGRRIAA